MDGVIFFRVSCAVEMEGLANLNAGVTVQRMQTDGQIKGETGDGRGGESLSEREEEGAVKT